MKIHPVFHVSRLKRYIDPTSFSPLRISDHRPSPVTIDGSEEYEIEKIVDKRTHHGRLQDLVHWLGYDSSEDSWIDDSDLDHARDLLDDFEDNLPLQDQFPSFDGGVCKWFPSHWGMSP